MRRRPGKPDSITDARPSVHAERHQREVRYAAMMSVRVVFLVIAVVLAENHVGAAWLWVPLCLAGMVVLPWLAVQTANEPNRRRRGRPRSTPVQPGLPILAAASAPVTIDSEVVDPAPPPAN